MSRSSKVEREALWEAMIVRAESAHDLCITGQRAASAAAARRIARYAHEISVLAEAAVLLGKDAR